MQPEVLQREFDRRKPWVTKFVINGHSYGGQYDPLGDPRMDWFRQAFPAARTVVDLGSLEGAQSFRLAESPTIEHILGLEVRPANINKAQFVARLLGLEHKVSFAQANLESCDLTEFGRFDAAFCCGVLYHLPEPWRLIQQIARVTQNIFVWTHYAAEDRAKLVRNGYRGHVYRELGWQDPQSGASPESYWVTLTDLQKMLRDYGFAKVSVIEDNPHTALGPVTTLAGSKD